MPNRRTKGDEDDALMNYSAIAVYLTIIYHLIVGCYYSLNSASTDGTGKSLPTLLAAKFIWSEVDKTP